MTTSYIRVEEDLIDQTNEPGLIARVLSRVLPKANPDFERLHRSVGYWYLEVHDSKPTREIGFTHSGEPIVLGPFEDNYGLWTDSPILLEPSEYPSVAPEEFESAWLSLCERLEQDIGHEPA